jgi:putative salt-induced outer membrane protein YdiY
MKSKALWLSLALTVAAGVAGAVQADEGPGAWDPASPLPEEFDWVQLTSGEWLKGEIFVMYDDTLEFESDELDMLSLDFEDIRQIRSSRTVQVALVDGDVVTGRLLVDGDEVRVTGDEERTFGRAQVLSLAAGEPRERNFWSGTVGAGANYRRGNTDQAEVNVQASFQRRTVKNRVDLQYLGNYNTTDDVRVTDNQRASGAWDRFVSPRFFLSPVQLEYFRDPFQNISQRWTIGAGAGYQILDTSTVDWQVNAGLAYQHTRFDAVPEGEIESASTPALFVSTAYDHELTDGIDLNVDYRFFLVDEESGRYTHHFVTGLEFDLFGSLDFFTTFVWDRIEKPRPTADGTLPKKDDYRLNLGLVLDF